jgi:dinuclear metal center YbgI/SA1388 family protein
MPTVGDFVQFLHQFAPLSTAADWDNVGLLVGDSQSSADRVMTCLTVTPPVVEEAIRERVGLIVSHHPVLFRATKKLTAATPDGRLLLPLIRAGVAVYSPHTAFDNCPGGINDGICRRLGLTNVRPLRTTPPQAPTKLAVFVPDEALGKVMDAVFAAGAGAIGNYAECSFRTPGTGTFFGNDAANPAVGEKGRREEVSEQRLEVIVPSGRIEAVVAGMRRAHPYEEPAFDVYPLHPATLRSSSGSGRIGELPNPVPLGALAATAKRELRANGVQVVGIVTKPVQRIAVACGAAGEFLSDSVRANADVFLTGEIRFHDALAAEAAGVGLILPGHYATERPGVEDLADRLAAEFPAVAVWASRSETDPLAVV